MDNGVESPALADWFQSGSPSAMKRDLTKVLEGQTWRPRHREDRDRVLMSWKGRDGIALMGVDRISQSLYPICVTEMKGM